ncbi:carboxyl methyl esterase [Scheffersomyces xylosifermentans]|uniref:carboxyl methyl esterase n=1 Tax=Scheffersomyces xylosifermentans TaxID=1304137 RepID=UPI00315D7579
MSDLHKAFLKRIKDQERALGLSSIAHASEEDEQDADEVNDSISDLSFASPLARGKHSTLKAPKQQLTKPTPIVKSSEDAKLDDAILSKYNSLKKELFPISEFYTSRPEVGSVICFQTYYRPPKSKADPICICVHGAGSSAMTFAFLTQSLAEVSEHIGVFLFDFRGHGGSSPTKDFSMDTLVEDLKFILEEFSSRHDVSTNPIYLVGHSLGGAVVSCFLKRYQDEVKYVHIKGSVVLDIVEETAVKSLSAMPDFISNRPKSFPSVSRAIKWHKGFLLFNNDSAEISVPDLLDLDKLTWKTDLRLTQPYWDTWFDKLSENFLSFKDPKLLILSAHETLDKSLMIGQMQGKYQLVVFSNQQKYGHFIHEDLPRQVAVCLVDFIKRNEDPNTFMREELGIVPKWGGKIQNN